MTQKSYKINNIRAIAIISVVIGHSIILYSSQWTLYQSTQTSIFLDYIKRLINLYQMPLFFSLSGYLFSLTWKKPRAISFFVNKIRRLIIPFVTIGLFWMIPIKMFIGYPSYSGLSYIGAVYSFLTGQNLGHLWYLPVLFIIFFLMYFLILKLGNIAKSYIIILCLSLLLNVFRNILPSLGLSYIYEYLWSFVLGALIFQIKPENISKKVLIILSLTALSSSLFYIFIKQSYSLIASFSIIVLLYSLVTNKPISLAEYLSKNSFGVYLFHSPLIYITFTYLLNAPPLIVTTINFFLFGGISLLITSYIRKTPLKIVIGE